MQVYFDNAATTQVCPQARSKMDEVMERLYGNPSSLHTMGMESEAVLKHARRQIAGLLDVPEECVYLDVYKRQARCRAGDRRFV